jgi:hypothetical protein
MAWWRLVALKAARSRVDTLPGMTLDAMGKLRWSRKHVFTTFSLHRTEEGDSFLWAGGVEKGSNLHTHLSAQYGDNASPRRSVCDWSDMFKKGRAGVTDSESSGHPSTATSDERQKQARAMILKDSNKCKLFRCYGRSWGQWFAQKRRGILSERVHVSQGNSQLHGRKTFGSWNFKLSTFQNKVQNFYFCVSIRLN